MDPQPATPADVPDLLSIFRACFHDAYFNAIFPPNDTGTSYLVDAFTRFVTPGEPSNIAVVRDETGNFPPFPLPMGAGRNKGANTG